MLREQKIVKEQATVFISNGAEAHLEIGNSRFGIGILMVMAGFLGLWGCVSFINGITQIHSVQELGRIILTALTGI